MSGLSKPGLRRLHDVMARYVERGEVPGLVTLIKRRDEVHVDAIGTLDRDGAGPPMQRDTIFRITSMTKPIAAAVALTLVEDCRLRLDDPLDEWLPELAGRRVLRDPEGPLEDTVPARRPITLRDLLTFRLGFGAIFGSSSPIERAARDPRRVARPGREQAARRGCARASIHATRDARHRVPRPQRTAAPAVGELHRGPGNRRAGAL